MDKATTFTHDVYSFYLFAWNRARCGQEASTTGVWEGAATSLGLVDGFGARGNDAGEPGTFDEVKSHVERLMCATVSP